jgi:hypothetical protein
MKRLAISLSACVALAVATAPAASAKFTFFQTPSKNIGCVISGKLGARCDIKQHSWSTPPAPPSCLDLDYGEGAEVGRHGRGGYVCAGDTVFSPSAEVLGYGERISAKVFRCASKQKGMRCVNRATKHGFFISRSEVRLF